MQDFHLHYRYSYRHSHLPYRYSFRYNHHQAPPALLTVRLVSDLVRSPTTHIARRLYVSIASVLYLLPFIIGADLLEQ